MASWVKKITTILYIKVTGRSVCLSGQFPGIARTFVFFFFFFFCQLNWPGSFRALPGPLFVCLFFFFFGFCFLCQLNYPDLCFVCLFVCFFFLMYLLLFLSFFFWIFFFGKI
jgi:hypothetical protein